MSEDISYFERWKEAHLRERESRAEYEREFEAIRVEQKFEEWMSEYRRSYGMYPGAGAYSRRSMRYAFRAGAKSQQARIAELEAEQERLIADIGHAESLRMDLVRKAKARAIADGNCPICNWGSLRRGLHHAPDCPLEALIAITPKEESRG